MKIILSLACLCFGLMGQTSTINGVPNQALSGPNPAFINTNCMYRYYFNEGSGTTATDQCSTNNGTFTASHNPTWATDGTGINTNGSQSVTVPVTWANVKTFYVALRPDITATRASTGVLGAIVSGSGGQPALGFGGATNTELGVYVGSAFGPTASLCTIPLYGPVVIAFTFGTNASVFINGTPCPSYTNQATVNPASSVTMLLGDYAPLVGQVYGFRGEIYFSEAFSTTAHTQSQVFAESAAISQYISTNKGLIVQPNLSALFYSVGIPWIADGDSIAESAGVIQWPGSYTANTLALMPVPLSPFVLGWSGVTLASLVSSASARVDTIANQYPNIPAVVSIHAGTNDLNGGASAATVYGNMQTYTAARRAASEKVVAVTTLSRAAPVDTNRGALNSSMQSGFLNGTLVTDAVSFWGFDPNMGQNGQFSSTWYTDAIHPSGPGNGIGATYYAPALLRAIGQGYIPVCNNVDIDNAVSATWRLNFNGTGNGPGSAVTAGLTQAVPLWYIGPKFKLVSTEIRTLTAFTGTTTLLATIGDSVGGNTLYDSNSYDLTAATSNTNFHDATQNQSSTYAGSNLVLSLTATGSNLTSITAGKVRVTFCVASIP